MRKGSEVEEERGVGGAEVRDGNIAGMKNYGGKKQKAETGPENAAIGRAGCVGPLHAAFGSLGLGALISHKVFDAQ